MTSPTQKGRHRFQLIDGKGEFNDKGLHDFITATNFSKCGVDYALIAIIGPQSSGKSAFMNHFGGTNFEVMNSLNGRKQTTEGIWIANCVTIDRPFTIAMDIEGTDGEERGKDDTAFEGQSALFVLAVADTVIVNLWCNDIGRQNASCTTLLERVLEIRMLRMDRSRKVKLCFILRDKTTTPLKLLKKQIKTTMEKMWTTIARSNGFKRTNMSDFFHVLVFGLPNYETQRKEFKNQVAELRGKILSVDRKGVVPAVAFQANAHKLWKSIKEETFLNLPSEKIKRIERKKDTMNALSAVSAGAGAMVLPLTQLSAVLLPVLAVTTAVTATFRYLAYTYEKDEHKTRQDQTKHMCKKIAKKWLQNLTSSKGLMELKKKVEAGPVKEFGDELHRLMETTLSKYRSDVQHFKRSIRKEIERELKSEILEILHPLYVTVLGHVRNKTFQEFKKKFTKRLTKGVTFDAAFDAAYKECYNICKSMLEEKCKDVEGKLSSDVVRKLSANCNKKLCNEIEKYATGIKKLKEKYQDKVADYIKRELEKQLQDCTEDTYWKSIRGVVSDSTSEALIKKFSSDVATYWEDKSLSNKMIQELKTYARNVVVDKLRAEVDKDVVSRMIDRFGSVFWGDKDSTKMDLAGADEKEITKAMEHAQRKAIKFLSVMAVVQFDEKSNNCIGEVSLSALKDANSSIWKGVSEDDTIIAPSICKALWTQFVDTKIDIVKEVIPDLKEIKRVKREEQAMQVMYLSAKGARPVAALLAGFLGVAVGDYTFTVIAAPVGVLFTKFAEYFKKKKQKAELRAKNLQKKHQQRCRKLKKKMLIKQST